MGCDKVSHIQTERGLGGFSPLGGQAGPEVEEVPGRESGPGACHT